MDNASTSIHTFRRLWLPKLLPNGMVQRVGAFKGANRPVQQWLVPPFGVNARMIDAREEEGGPFVLVLSSCSLVQSQSALRWEKGCSERGRPLLCSGCNPYGDVSELLSKKLSLGTSDKLTR